MDKQTRPDFWAMPVEPTFLQNSCDGKNGSDSCCVRFQLITKIPSSSSSRIKVIGQNLNTILTDALFLLAPPFHSIFCNSLHSLEVFFFLTLGVDLQVLFHMEYRLNVLWLNVWRDVDICCRYNLLFVFLLRVRRVQLQLQQCWALQMHRRHLRFTAESDPGATTWWLRNHMAFLVDNLQYYLQV